MPADLGKERPDGKGAGTANTQLSGLHGASHWSTPPAAGRWRARTSIYGLHFLVLDWMMGWELHGCARHTPEQVQSLQLQQLRGCSRTGPGLLQALLLAYDVQLSPYYLLDLWCLL
ncbi:hypothetical protein H920_00113 [Fukomys damarensis]|uniref:Uncharacterized protein n=1 Tax=Fukomys damarensis TaxID=885580 RepID=A0A091E257_FUKDA|nr:hypothetical protein H920_00113 [Fukomys damarensis]